MGIFGDIFKNSGAAQDMKKPAEIQREFRPIRSHVTQVQSERQDEVEDEHLPER